MSFERFLKLFVIYGKLPSALLDFAFNLKYGGEAPLQINEPKFQLHQKYGPWKTHFIDLIVF